MAEYAKPLPIADPDSQPFWDACKRHELTAQRCRGCGRWRFPPRGVCPSCYSWEADWLPLPGTGNVQTFVVPHRAFSPAFSDELPYVVAHVVLDDTDGNVVMIGNLLGCQWTDVQVGMPVRVNFEDATEEVALPKFKPA